MLCVCFLIFCTKLMLYYNGEIFEIVNIYAVVGMIILQIV